MDAEKIRQKARGLLAKANELTEEAQQLTLDGDLESANAKSEEAEQAIEQARSLKKSIDNLDAASELDFGEPQATRPPFDTTDEGRGDSGGEEPSTTKGITEGVYTIRYGDINDSLKAVVKDLYGTERNYYEQRDKQQDAFVKYVRAGDARLNVDDYKMLKTLILTPDTLKAEIAAGASVSDIKTAKANTLVEALGDLGGYLVPEDYRLSIVKKLMGAAIVRGLARTVNTSRDSVEWPKLEGGDDLYTSAVRMTWVDEIPGSATVAQTNPTFGMLRIPTHTVMARVDLSRNLLEDSAFNLLQILAELFSEAMAIDEDSRFLTGTGAGVPKGVLGNRTGAEENPVTGIDSVASGNASALTADGIIDLIYGLPQQYRGNAVLVGARLTHRDIRKLKDGNGQYLWQPGLSAGEPATILGYPFLESENMPAIGANKYPLIFGDFRGYMVVDRVGMTVERVTDVTTVGTNKVAIFARRRLGGQVIEPWRFQAQKVATS